MTQQTVNPGGTVVAEPPGPFLPGGDADSAPDNRRKLILVAAAVGVLVLGIAAFFLLKGGGSPASSSGGLVANAHHPGTGSVAAPKAPVTAPVTLPKKVKAAVGRDPFKVLYSAPVAAAPGVPSGTTGQPPTSTSTTPTTSGTGVTSGTGTTTAATYHPVWIELKSVTSTTATFDVGYSNGKTLRAIRYVGVKAPKSGSETAFAKTFALLGVSGGQVVVKYGDGTPFRLDMQHNFMVVD